MAEPLSYNPLTGVQEWIEVEEGVGEDIWRIRKEQDIEPILNFTAAVRNSGASDEHFKQDDFACLYAVIPLVVEVELLNKGINIHDPGCTKRLLEEINTNYPYLKTTDKVHVANH